MGNIRVTELAPEHIERLLRGLARTGLSRTTLVKIRSLISQTLTWAERRRTISWNPGRLAELPPADTTKPPRVPEALDISEAQRVLEAARGHRLEALLAVELTCGLHPGELQALRWTAVDRAQGTITVSQSMIWHRGHPSVGPTKTRRIRTLSVPPELIETLDRHRAHQDVERRSLGPGPDEWADLVFVSEAGTPIDPANLRCLVRVWGRQAGLDKQLTPYGLRHSACTILCDDGVRAELVADVLGHVDTRMVMLHYRHQTAPSVTAALATGGRLLSGKKSA